MFTPESRSDTPEPNARLRTLDRVIKATSLFQKPLLVTISRGLPSASVILGMTFLAPKIQEFSCVQYFDSANDTLPRPSSMEDARCYRNGVEKCAAWTYSTEIFAETVKSEVSPSASFQSRLLGNVAVSNFKTLQFDTVCDREWILKLSVSLVMVGMMAGNFIFSHVSDW